MLFGSFFPILMINPVYSRRRFLGAAGAYTAGALCALGADKEPYKVAVIGHTGRGNFGHGLDTMWLNVPGVKIAAVADADAKGLENARKRLGEVPGYADYRQMLGEVRPDIVSIALRHVDQHLAMVLAATEAGAKGIYIEKPLCRTPGEADEIVAACAKAGTRLAIAHRNHYHPVLPVVRQMIADGVIGSVVEYRMRGKEDARGGAEDLWVLGSHLLDLLHAFEGPAVACAGQLYAKGLPAAASDVVAVGAEGLGRLAGDAVHARWEMASGVPAYFDSVRNQKAGENSFGLQILGTKGVIDFRIDTDPLVQLRLGNPFRPIQGQSAWVPVSSAGVGVAEPLAQTAKQVANHFTAATDLLAAIAERRDPLCSAAHGKVITESICAVFESHLQGGARVLLPVKDRGNPLARLQQS